MLRRRSWYTCLWSFTAVSWELSDIQRGSHSISHVIRCHWFWEETELGTKFIHNLLKIRQEAAIYRQRTDIYNKSYQERTYPTKHERAEHLVPSQLLDVIIFLSWNSNTKTPSLHHQQDSEVSCKKIENEFCHRWTYWSLHPPVLYPRG